MLTSSDKETELVEKEREKAESINANLRRQLQDYIVPEVHYKSVSCIADLSDLACTISTITPSGLCGTKIACTTIQLVHTKYQV